MESENFFNIKFCKLIIIYVYISLLKSLKHNKYIGSYHNDKNENNKNK